MENVKPKLTMDDVNEAWKKWEAYKETVEQYDFFNVFWVFWKEIRFKAMYTSLKTDWSEDHAAIFLRRIDIAMGKSEAKDG